MKFREIFLSAIFVSAILIFVWGGKAQNCNAIYHNDKTIRVGSKQLKTEIVSTYFQEQTGLSGRACIAQDQAMLFDFGSLGYYPIWMKNMHFPVDMVWVNNDKQVVKLETNVFPFSYPKKFVNTQLARYVLELKSGQIRSLGIEEGTILNL